MKSNKNVFEIGMNSSEVIRNIVRYQRDIAAITLVLHHVSINWRQEHTDPSSQISNYKTSLHQVDPVRIRMVSREDVLSDLETEIGKTKKSYENEHAVVSVASRVNLVYGGIRHIPMMNFHPEIGHDQLRAVINFLREIGEKEGVILESGRYFHYYGNRLISEREWIKFSATFLKPVVLVSPRYIGQVFHNNYSTLRLTKDDTYKPRIPSVVHILQES